MYDVSTYLKQANLKGEDALIVFTSNDSILLCISDGAGGISGGMEASTQVCQYCVEQMEYIDKITDITEFEALLKKLDNKLYHDKNMGEATCVLVQIQDKQIIGASVGDSECWIFRDDCEYELTMFQRKKPLLGSGNCQPIGFGPFTILGDIIIGSDGLFKYTNIQEIKKRVLSKEYTAKDLGELPTQQTGYLQDDLSIILVRE
jgi:serine/threonine protein phosphatase PrpC